MYKTDPVRMTLEEFEGLRTILTPQQELKQTTGEKWKTKSFTTEQWWFGECRGVSSYGVAQVDYSPILVFCTLHEEEFPGPCPKCANGEW